MPAPSPTAPGGFLLLPIGLSHNHHHDLSSRSEDDEDDNGMADLSIANSTGAGNVMSSEKWRTTVAPEMCSDQATLARWATSASWFVNWLMLAIKIYIAAVSSSKSILAALVDSVVDLVSQAILSLAERYMSRYDADYPVGRARLEALSVLACAIIMAIASLEVIQYSIADLINGATKGILPELESNATTYAILGTGIFLKFFLWLFCRWAHRVLSSDLLEALAEDHFNDVISNSTAICTLAIAVHVANCWWVDALGAIVISVVIIGRWMLVGAEQVKKIVGHTAPPQFIEQVEEIARLHDSRLSVDCTRAYHFGNRYNVEMEIVLPGLMTVHESHDIALALQHKIEELADVERAFVHVDHEERDGLEHKVERELVKSALHESPTGSPRPAANELRIRRGATNKNADGE